MHVGLVTPPGLLGDFVACAVEPAGHALSSAPSQHALHEQAETNPPVVIVIRDFGGAIDSSATPSWPCSKGRGPNCGTVVRGDIGSRFVRLDYTCIGDVVNRAQRHESKAPLGDVLPSRDLYQRIAPQVIAEEMPGIT